MSNPVTSPAHYTGRRMSPIEVINEYNLSFALGNSVKYILRHDRKNEIEDLEKALWYLAEEIGRRHGLDFNAQRLEVIVQFANGRSQLKYPESAVLQQAPIHFQEAPPTMVHIRRHPGVCGVMLTGAEWQTILDDVIIVDRDGWHGDGAPVWGESKMTKEEYLRLRSNSTCDYSGCENGHLQASLDRAAKLVERWRTTGSTIPPSPESAAFAQRANELEMALNGETS